jgi:peptide/nickel transport system permease protein
MSAALEATVVAVLLGVPLGLLAGFASRLVDLILNTISDAIMSIPPLLLALVIVGVLGPGLTNAMLAIGFIVSPRFFRVAREATQSQRSSTYIEAARASGCSRWRMLWRHLLPNASGPLLVQVSFSVGLAVIAEASLSFLGLGIREPSASLGSMVQDAFAAIHTSTFGLYPPGFTITLIILCFSVVGDGVRDALGRERTTRT